MTVAADGGHLREPILFGIALLRALNADVQLDNPLYSRLRDMGQSLYLAPECVQLLLTVVQNSRHLAVRA